MNSTVRCIDCVFENNMDGAVIAPASCTYAHINPYTNQRTYPHPDFETNKKGKCPDFIKKVPWWKCIFGIR